MWWSWRTRISFGAAGFVALAVLAFAAPARGAEGWSWPVEGRVLTHYLNDDARPYAGGMHRGIDIAAAEGTPVRAAHAGEVTFAGVVGSSGLTISIRTEDGRYLTSYLHLEHVEVARGAHVGGGERIGTSGTSGKPSLAEPHLHFGVRLAGSDHDYVDPLSLLPALGGEPAGPSPAPVTQPAPVRAGPAPLPVPVPAQRRTARAPVARPLAYRTLHPFPSMEMKPQAAAVPGDFRAPLPAHVQAVRPHRAVAHSAPAGPRAELAPSRPVVAMHRPGREGSEEGGSPWWLALFAGGIVLAFSAALARPALRAGVNLRRRARRRGQRADEASEASSADPVPVLLAELQ
jgi:Peptidase family M23